MPKPIRGQTIFYHQTSIDHLQSIIENGLLSRTDFLRRGIMFNDVADPNIIERRFEIGLENYVPFHFHPRTPFDYKIREIIRTRNLCTLLFIEIPQGNWAL